MYDLMGFMAHNDGKKPLHLMSGVWVNVPVQKRKGEANEQKPADNRWYFESICIYFSWDVLGIVRLAGKPFVFEP